MGKWTPNYTDDVLHAKLSNLVSGSIRRAAVEKEPSISYENFVTDLETGDSFTASLVDILVKELADRRTRSSENDRKLIGERTIRGLRMLANSSRRASQRIGHTHPRRVSNRHEYLAAVANDMDLDEDDDEYEAMLDNPSSIEGARVNSDLYDAYAASVWPPPRAVDTNPPLADEWPTLPIRATEPIARPWNPVAPASSSNLTRQASIRRQQRSRVVDFHEYAHRRRSNVRESLVASRSDAPESVTEPRENISAGTVRRFFPFPRSRRYASTVSATWPELSDTLSPDSDDAGSPQYFLDHTSAAAWYTQNRVLDADALRSSSELEERRDELEALIRAPRLRLRTASEQVPSRHASPASNAISIPIVIADVPSTVTVTHPATEGPPTIAFPLREVPRREDAPSAPTDETVAYPTPGSIENDPVA